MGLWREVITPLGVGLYPQKDHQDRHSGLTGPCAPRHGSEVHSRSKFPSQGWLAAPQTFTKVHRKTEDRQDK